jgi:hypothetical protein
LGAVCSGVVVVVVVVMVVKWSAQTIGQLFLISLLMWTLSMQLVKSKYIFINDNISAVTILPKDESISLA